MKEPCMRLKTENGEEIEASRENTALYTFIGKAALYNHVFVAVDDENGIYTFQDSPHFMEMARFAINNEFPLHLNLFEVQDCDREAYEKYIGQLTFDLEDYPPQDWIANE